MRFLEKINESKLNEVRNLFKNSLNSRVRARAHSVLLSIRGFSINQISELYEIDRDTVSTWLNKWESKGMKGLSDLSKEGRPSKVCNDLKKK